MPAGTLEGPAGDAAIRFLGETRRPGELAQIPVAGSATGGEIRLGDLATIRERFDDPAQDPPSLEDAVPVALSGPRRVRDKVAAANSAA